MKKKSYYLFGTIIILVASIFSSATASACGGDMGYVEPKSSANVTYGAKDSIIVTSSPSKSYKGSRVFVDGVETPISLPQKGTSEKQRLLSVIKEFGCSIAKNPNFTSSEESVKKIMKKYGFKTDEASFNALEAKYEKDEEFKKKVEKTAKQAIIDCGGDPSLF